MRARKTAAVSAAALGVLALTAGPGSAGAEDEAATSGRHPGGVTTYAFSGGRVEESFLDLGEEGLTLGDQFHYTNEGAVEGLGRGRDYGSCSVHEAQDGQAPYRLVCTQTTTLSGGDITFQGVVELDPTTEDVVGGEGVWAVTGGTGVFLGVGGQAAWRPTNARGEPYAAEGELHLRWP